MIKFMAAFALALVVLQQPPIDPCATGETPCDPNRPWMRGRVEKSCGIPAEVTRLRREHPEKIILECHCQHTCDLMNDYTEQTDRRGWDALCQARCNPNNCTCPHPCDS